MITNLFSFESINQIFLVFSVAFYLVVCYLGYKCIKGLVAVVGFIIGFILVFIISAGVYARDTYYLPAALGLAAGVGFAFIAFKLYFVGVFILCGTLAARAVAELPFGNEWAQSNIRLILCLAAFLIVGIIAIKFAKGCIILVTSVSGAFNAVKLLETPIELLDESTVLKIAVIAFVAISGILVQQASVKGSK